MAKQDQGVAVLGGKEGFNFSFQAMLFTFCYNQKCIFVSYLHVRRKNLN
jgi:hypothetical protein